jgi:hypothetical protein
MDSRERGLSDMDWIYLALNKELWRTFVNKRWTLGFHKIFWVFWVDEWLAVSQEGPKFLATPGFELRPLGRSARSKSLYRFLSSVIVYNAVLIYFNVYSNYVLCVWIISNIILVFLIKPTMILFLPRYFEPNSPSLCTFPIKWEIKPGPLDL